MFHLEIGDADSDTGSMESDVQSDEYPLLLKAVTTDPETERKSVFLYILTPSGVVNETITVSNDGTILEVKFKWPEQLTEMDNLNAINEQFVRSVETRVLLKGACRTALKQHREKVIDDIESLFRFRLPFECSRTFKSNPCQWKNGTRIIFVELMAVEDEYANVLKNTTTFLMDTTPQKKRKR